MKMKLLALAFLLSQQHDPPATEAAMYQELSQYSTKQLFEMMIEGDHNTSFSPAVVFACIKNRNDYTGQQLIHYLNEVRFCDRNASLKHEVCRTLLEKNDYTVQELSKVFSLDGANHGNVYGTPFLEKKLYLQKKFALCTVGELSEITNAAKFPFFITELAKSAAEAKLSTLSTETLLVLLEKGTKIRVEAELVKRTEEIKKLAFHES